ncbi:MAG TPA: TM2 domain-containing protein [Firmicutes bacterium]|nr:TM2 domain-containing protein [Bacillota bacterium]
MFCKNCGNQMDDLAVICVKCGAAKGTGANFCPNCGAPTMPGANVCTQCGVALYTQAPPMAQQKSKMAAGLLGIFLGGWGIHNFYLGFTTRAIIQIVVTVCTCGIGALWGFIEGILILTGSINADANGIPLRD